MQTIQSRVSHRRNKKWVCFVREEVEIPAQVLLAAAALCLSVTFIWTSWGVKACITVLIQTHERECERECERDVCFGALWLCRTASAVRVKIDGALDAEAHFPCFSFALHFPHDVDEVLSLHTKPHRRISWDHILGWGKPFRHIQRCQNVKTQQSWMSWRRGHERFPHEAWCCAFVTGWDGVTRLNTRHGSSECISLHLNVEATCISSARLQTFVLHSVLCLQRNPRVLRTVSICWKSGCAPTHVVIGWTVLLTQIYGTFRLVVILLSRVISPDVSNNVQIQRFIQLVVSVTSRSRRKEV